ncbi:hypothetical protein [Aurantimonas sp. VKM B-3413]|uniref:hypothetical protein n=1 Tax=Aurantimonas sp. VKM B-3413 TaxID=2779401 RepID=UPI001E410B9F|nr:hypothetical protein [Aurantimonas sp. VKM B-3413]
MLTFEKAFRLASADMSLPAGTYRVLIESEEIPGLSFSAYRRSLTLQLPAISVRSNRVRMLPVDTDDLVAALQADGQDPTGRF